MLNEIPCLKGPAPGLQLWAPMLPLSLSLLSPTLHSAEIAKEEKKREKIKWMETKDGESTPPTAAWGGGRQFCGLLRMS